MKTKNLLGAVSLALTFIFFFPAVTFAQGNWTQKADFQGGERYSAASFSIGTKGYIGIGYSSGIEVGSGVIPMRDFWEWDQATNIWTRKADFPGKITGAAASFSIGNKGYIGTGSSSDSAYEYLSNEFWEYDPASNNWTQKASIPSTIGRSDAVGFSIGTKGYIGTGWKWNECDFHKEFWEWDQTTDTWTQKADFKGVGRTAAVGFSIGDKGYIGTGWSFCDDTNFQDFWEWDQNTNVWTQKADYPGGLTFGAVGLSIGNKGYIGTGWNGAYQNEFWEWDPETNLWTRKGNLSGIARNGAASFTIGGKGYIGTGGDGGYYSTYSDFWEFTLSSVTGLEEVTNENNFFYPNPASDFITLNTRRTDNSGLTLNIYNISGELINSETILQNHQNININGLSNGIYIIELNSKGGLEKQKLIVQR